MKQRLLLHICCAGCGAFVSQLLNENYNLTLYYYNSNIDLEHEYEKRLDEVKMIADKYNLGLIVGKYDHTKWLDMIKGLEHEPEKGSRCYLCYKDRLRSAAQTAKENNFDLFTTTLTVSPRKIARWVFEIGNDLKKEFDVKFLEQDFKKQDGAKKASRLSKELNLYRQNYCGCEFSK